MKLPAYMFYPGDWMKDPAVRSVGYAARGLWKDMLCLMHESPRRGYLQHENGKPVTTEQLARMTGGSVDEVAPLLKELDNSGVFSRSEHGIIYSRRMVKDEQLRRKAAEYGRLGGNPELVKGKDKGGLKARAKPNPTPSVSIAVSNSVSKETTSIADKPQNSQVAPLPPKELTHIQRVVNCWRRTLEIPKEEVKTWEKAHYGRCSKSAKLLLEIFGFTECTPGELETIADCMVETYDGLKKVGLECTLETVVKRAHEWRIKNGITHNPVAAQ